MTLDWTEGLTLAGARIGAGGKAGTQSPRGIMYRRYLIDSKCSKRVNSLSSDMAQRKHNQQLSMPGGFLLFPPQFSIFYFAFM